MTMTTLGEAGDTHVVTGTITAGGTLACSDGSAELTDNGTGDWTVTFGSAFLSTPRATANVIDATFAATQVHQVAIQAKTASTVRFHAHTITLAAATTSTSVAAAADIDIDFIVIGKRNR